MRKKLPGVNKATKKLKDGTVKTYYYAWRGGPLLADADGRPLDPNDPRFFVAYTDAVRVRHIPNKGTLQGLVDLYRSTTEFTARAPNTKKAYARYLRIIEEEHGDMTLADVEHKKARGDFKAWRDSMKETPRAADYAWTVLARVLSVAKDHGKIAVNVCERGGRLYVADRTEAVWAAEHIRKFCAVASSDLQFALLLALWTGQRQGDLLRLQWAGYDGTAIRLRQGKTKARVTVPVGATLKAALDAASPGKGPLEPILTNSRGKPWTEDGFRASWIKAFDRAGIDADLHFHDLRGTAVTRLALAGCTVPQIAAITGHSPIDAERILSAHYLGGKVELAEEAMLKLNAKYGGG